MDTRERVDECTNVYFELEDEPANDGQVLASKLIMCKRYPNIGAAIKPGDFESDSERGKRFNLI